MTIGIEGIEGVTVEVGRLGREGEGCPRQQIIEGFSANSRIKIVQAGFKVQVG